ncbi:MAG: hypothetical protein M3Y33_06365, partial [Actinomycetota bacterium]|nr:hypothetical protein [Actinomycetota bacterium]
TRGWPPPPGGRRAPGGDPGRAAGHLLDLVSLLQRCEPLQRRAGGPTSIPVGATFLRMPHAAAATVAALTVHDMHPQSPYVAS